MKYYDELSKGYDKLYSEEQESKFLFLNEWLNSFKGLALDLGAGTGLLNKHFKPFVSADYSIKMLRLNNNPNKVCCDARYLPFKDNSFDNIICFTILQDIADKAKVLSEINRVFKSRVIITFIKRGKSLSTVKKWFKDFKILDFREHEKDYCFLLSKHI